MLVSEVMNQRPATIGVEATMGEARHLLERRAISVAPVVDEEGLLCGVVSAADLILDQEKANPRATLCRGTQPLVSILEVMTKRVLTVSPEDDVRRATDWFVTSGVKAMPVVDAEQHVVGMLSRSDLVQLIMHRDEELERRVVGVLHEAGMGDWRVAAHDGVVRVSGPADSVDEDTVEVMVRALPGVLRVVVGQYRRGAQ